MIILGTILLLFLLAGTMSGLLSLTKMVPKVAKYGTGVAQAVFDLATHIPFIVLN